MSGARWGACLCTGKLHFRVFRHARWSSLLLALIPTRLTAAPYFTLLPALVIQLLHGTWVENVLFSDAVLDIKMVNMYLSTDSLPIQKNVKVG